MVNQDEVVFGDGISPYQTALPETEIKPDPTFQNLRDLLDNLFGKPVNGAGSQWKGTHIWVEFNGPSVIIWNALNMRYHHHKPPTIKAAIEWITENHDKPQPVPDEWQV